jgi:hypothetical protein
MRIESVIEGDNMARNESKNLPPFGSLDELVEHFDAHDWGDYLEQMPQADFEVGDFPGTI